MESIELYEITQSELTDILDKVPMFHRRIGEVFAPEIKHLRNYTHAPEFAEYHVVYLYQGPHHLVAVVANHEEVTSQCVIKVEAWNGIGKYPSYSIDQKMEKRIIQAIQSAREFQR